MIKNRFIRNGFLFSLESEARRTLFVRTNGHLKNRPKCLHFVSRASAFIKARIISVKVLVVQIILNDTERRLFFIFALRKLRLDD